MIKADTGKHVAPQSDAITVPIDWLRKHGVDLDTGGLESERTLRTAVDMVISQYTKDAWRESTRWTPEQAREFIAGNLVRHKSSPGRVIGSPGTYAFRTREGSVGIMQLLPPPEDKPEATVRYKLLKASTAESESATNEPPDDEQSAKAHRVDEVVLPVTGVVARLKDVKQIPASSDWPQSCAASDRRRPQRRRSIRSESRKTGSPGKSRSTAVGTNMCPVPGRPLPTAAKCSISMAAESKRIWL